ncbi:MAG: 6-phosphofructokinase [Bdellovibrionales bacterium]|nr:6-phosphofructokinase [Bdellovibrionales bacterium]
MEAQQDKRAVAIVVGGGPAPGINGVISAATIAAIKQGHTVYGIYKGFERIAAGDASCIKELTISDVSRIDAEGGSMLLTSRANPKKSPEMLENVVRLLQEKNVGYLVTIGGDDTAASAKAVADAASGSIAVAHVPKTIDNDLPLPGHVSTFGFQTAREVGTAIVETLMNDAKTTSRWYLVIAMGRKAGHLAMGIGVSASATLSVIPEEFPDKKVPLGVITDIIAGSILKRLVHNRPYGVAVLAEGLAEILDQDSIPELAGAERDPHGNIRFAELDFGRLIRTAVRDRLAEFGMEKLLVIDKNVGYELRCHAPNAFDRAYTKELGYGAIEFLLDGGSEAMIIRRGDDLAALPFAEFIDPKTGRAEIRMVDTNSTSFKIARKYQIRMTEKNLGDPAFTGALSKIVQRTPEAIATAFAAAAKGWGAFPETK